MAANAIPPIPQARFGFSVQQTKETSNWEKYTKSLTTVSGAKDFFKSYLCITKGAELCGVVLCQQTKGLRTIASIIKNGLEAPSVPKKVVDITTAIGKGQFGKALSEIVDSIHVLYDLTELLVAQSVVLVSAVVMRQFLFLNHLSLIYVQGKEALKQRAACLNDKLSKTEKDCAFYKMCKAVSYVCLGAFGVIAFTFSFVYPGWVMYAWSTSALFFSIYSRFFEPQSVPAVRPPHG